MAADIAAAGPGIKLSKREKRKKQCLRQRNQSLKFHLITTALFKAKEIYGTNIDKSEGKLRFQVPRFVSRSKMKKVVAIVGLA
ncbi:MAG: hypothetical protein ABIW76_09270, partial [Fibrobacteria bacterium]